jgi:FkbM family methyltransferase
MSSPRFLGLKAMAAAVVKSPLAGKIVATVFNNRIPYRGLTIVTSSPVVRPKIKAAIFGRMYESAEARFLLQHLPREFDAIELGSSLGVISCLAKRKIAPRRLVCVEAHPDVIEVAKSNIHFNGLAENTVFVGKALGYDSPTLTFLSGKMSNSGRVAAASEKQEGLTVPTTTLAAILREHNIQKFSLIADIEGMEWELFEKDEGAFRNCQFILLEMHSRPGSTDPNLSPLRERILGLGFETVDSYGPVACFRRRPSSN